MGRRILITISILVGFAGLEGCRHCCKRPLFGSRNDLPPVPRGGFLDSPRSSRDDILIPPPTGGLPAPSGIPADPSLPPPVIGSEPSGSRFRPGVETLRPDPLLESPAIRPSAPTEPPPVIALPGESSSRKQNSSSSTSVGYADRTNPPTGLPGFSVVSNRVATGRKPALEGLDRLQAIGYKTLVYLHDPAEDITAIQELVEKKRLVFISIPTNPENVKAAFSRFAEVIGDPSNLPVYVCDTDGVRTGSLWYLYFRVIESSNDDTAQVKAASLGLRDANDAEKKRFWIAIQNYLSKR